MNHLATILVVSVKWVKWELFIYNICLFRLNGGELFERLMQESIGLNEMQSRRIIRQLLEAVKHLHHNNLVHLDIKVATSPTSPSFFSSFSLPFSLHFPTLFLLILPPFFCSFCLLLLLILPPFFSSFSLLCLLIFSLFLVIFPPFFFSF